MFSSSQSIRERRLSLEDQGVPEGIGVFLIGATSSPTVDPDCSAKVIRANPQGRRRHSSETFSSTATVTPVFPSFARGDTMKRHSSVENISSRSSEGSDEEYGSPVNRQSSAGYPSGLNYIALNLLDSRNVEKCEDLAGFKPASSCKGGINGLHSTPYVCLGFKEAATTAKGERAPCHVNNNNIISIMLLYYFEGTVSNLFGFLSEKSCDEPFKFQLALNL